MALLAYPKREEAIGLAAALNTLTVGRSRAI